MHGVIPLFPHWDSPNGTPRLPGGAAGIALAFGAGAWAPKMGEWSKEKANHPL